MKRHEEKLPAGRPTMYLIMHSAAPFGVHGAYSTEKKVTDELKRLSKEPSNRLTKKQKTHNKKCAKWPHNGRVPFKDPMDAYSIYEVTVE